MKTNYQFTLTENYVSNWGYLEGIRELLQNAYDYGNYDISFDLNSITIKNFNDKLSTKTLLMGYGTKHNDKNSIGGFGEGFILALLVLVRQGFDVIIENADELWKPEFIISEEFDGERLFNVVVTKDYSDSKDLSITISGFSPEQLESMKQEFLGLSGSYNSIKTLYGEILLDKEQKGKMYVEGLPITFNPDFDYGYNFKAEYVLLDRDRKDINHRELKKITSMAIISMENDDFDFVDKVVESGKEDADSFVRDDIEVSESFIEKYSNHLQKRFNVNDKSVVATKSDEKVIKELERMGESVVTVDRKVYANVINKTSEYSHSMYEKAFDRVSSRSRYDDAWSYYDDSSYKKLKNWFDSYGESLSQSAKIALLEVLENMEPYLFYLIKDEIWSDEETISEED